MVRMVGNVTGEKRNGSLNSHIFAPAFASTKFFVIPAQADTGMTSLQGGHSAPSSTPASGSALSY